MKNFKFLKSLLVLIGVLITSLTSQVWAWAPVELVGEMPAINGSPYYFGTSGTGSTETYAANGNGFKLRIDGSKYVGYCNKSGEKSSITSDGTGTRLYTDYDGSEDENVTYSGCNGIVCFHYDQATGTHEYDPWVWITRPTLYFYNTWNSGNSYSWKSAVDEGNGYYYVDATYGRDGVNWGTSGYSSWTYGDNAVWPSCTPTPSTLEQGEKCRYRLNTNPSGDSWDERTPTLAIYKLVTVTYDGNGKTSGSVPSNQDVPYNLAETLKGNTGNLAKTDYVFTGWNTKADGTGDHYDAGASITITANTTLYAEWNRKWAVQGSGTEMGAWSTYNYLAPTGTADEFSGTIDLAANTTYVFKLRNREDNTLWGYGDNGTYQLAYIGQSSAHAHNLESTDGKKDLVLMSAKAGTYTFTYNQSTKRLTVGFPSQTHPNTNNIYFKNSGTSTYTGVCINIYGGATDGVSGWERMPSMPTCTIDGQTYYYSAIGDNTKCKFANAANSSTNTGEKTGIQSQIGKYYDLASSSWKSFVFDITYKDQGNVAFSGTHNDSPSAHPTTHTFGSSTSLNTASKTGYDFGGWYTNSDCTVGPVSSLSATGYTADITLYAQWTPVDLTFSTAGSWGTASNWSPACVPTSGHDVTISAAATVSGAAVAKSIEIEGGSLTINAGAVLEVAGTITNTDASKLVIESNASNQGALILNNSASTKATVNIYTKLNTYDSYQVIALPVTYAGVSESFAGSGVYTYVWNEGDGWERRGYYDDLSAFEAIGLVQNASHTYTISGTLASTEDFSETLAYTTGTYQGTNVYGNSWTAPIKISEISIPAAYAEQTVYVLENGSWHGYELGGAKDADVVPAMQAFAIKATASGGSVSIDYDDAVRGNADYRTEALRAPQRTTIAKDYMALAITDGDRQTRLRLREDARFTEEFDNGWEATYLEGDGLSGQLFVQKDDKMVVLAEPDLEGTVVGLIPGVATDYTISFEGNGDGYYLNDLVTEQSTLIAEGNTYMFTADANTNATRFVISRTPIRNMPTGVDVINDGTKARKQLINGVLYIIRDGRLYNATGAKVK